MSLSYQTDETDAPAVETGEAASIPPPLFTLALIVAIGCVAAVQFATGLERSIEIAGFDKPAFIENREYWRILTGATLHGGILHVVMNCYAFYSFGRIFELLANRAHLAIVFLLAAIGGGVLSLIFAPDGLSVGASGGIVGVIGYLAVYAFRRRQFISNEFRKSLLINIGFLLIFGLVLYQVIDNYGHIGGLITGAAYGLVQIPGDPYSDPRIAGQAVTVAGLISLAIYIAGCTFCIFLILGFV